jgi:hypothetical protein
MTASFILAPTLPYARAIMEIMKEYFMLQWILFYEIILNKETEFWIRICICESSLFCTRLLPVYWCFACVTSLLEVSPSGSHVLKTNGDPLSRLSSPSQLCISFYALWNCFGTRIQYKIQDSKFKRSLLCMRVTKLIAKRISHELLYNLFVTTSVHRPIEYFSIECACQYQWNMRPSINNLSVYQ